MYDPLLLVLMDSMVLVLKILMVLEDGPDRMILIDLVVLWDSPVDRLPTKLL